MNELKNANIRISSESKKQIKNGSVMTTVIDEEGKKYSFFNTKQDGSPSAAAKGYQGVNIGDVVEIGYEAQEKTFKDEKTGRDVTYEQRTIRTLRKAPQLNANGSYQAGAVTDIDDNATPF